MSLQTTPLYDGWTLDGDVDDPSIAGAFPLPALVPGTAMTDLHRRHLIPDPYVDENESLVQWVGRVPWVYRLRFEAGTAGEDRVDLAFDGLDTLAHITLNGHTVGATRNMHRRYRFDVGALLVNGSNELEVRFQSPWAPAEAAKDEWPDVYSPYAHIRKMACNFGWDWGPTLVTSGIWRPVRLERWRVARLASTRPVVDVADGNGIVRLEVDIERQRSEAVALVASIGGHTHRVRLGESETSALIDISVPDVELWWPRELGSQPLYSLDVRLETIDGAILDTHSDEIGFRTIVVNTAEDEHGSPFEIIVNGRLLPIRGANWIPDDCFPSRITAAQLEHRIDQAAEANVNLLRVWGGGIFESDDFYNACDRAGILVWQDFLFACSPYPEHAEMTAEVDAEARDNVERLMRHPSLALWNGNNENFLGWGWEEWHWPERIGDRTWGSGYYLDVLPKVVADVDPGRFYWPGSPYSGSPDIDFDDPARGVVHLWDAWVEKDYTVYREHPARFVAEFGWQGPANMSTLRDALSERPLEPHSPGMVAHQKAGDGMGKLSRGLSPHFDEPADFESWIWAMQLNQARAFRLGIEHFRSLRPLNTGMIIWQLNDCWPVTSWSVVDSAGRRKPAWYALREAYAPRLLTIQPRPDGLTVIAVDDNGQWDDAVTITRRRLDGTVLTMQASVLSVQGINSWTMPLDAAIASPDDPKGEVIVAESASGQRAWWYFVEDREMDYPPAELGWNLEETGAGVRVTATARTFVRDLALLVDMVSGVSAVDRQLLTMFPGESTTFTVTGVSAHELRDALPAVARTANGLVGVWASGASE